MYEDGVGGALLLTIYSIAKHDFGAVQSGPKKGVGGPARAMRGTVCQRVGYYYSKNYITSLLQSVSFLQNFFPQLFSFSIEY
jgi:hypothetical protein